MSDNSLEQQQNQYRSPTEIQTLTRMRWCLLIAILIWLLFAMVATVVVIFITRSLLSLSFYSSLAPPTYLIYWIVKHLFPMDERRYLLAKAKIEMKAQKSLRVKQVDINRMTTTPQAGSPDCHHQAAHTTLDQGIIAEA
jgi:hypothetical protein